MQQIPMFNLGVMELLVVAILGLLCLAVPILIVVVVVTSSARRHSNHEATNPNLVPCPDCQKLISIHATACPHCGRPAKGAV